MAKKYYEKKTKKTTGLSVGDNPVFTPGSLESASLTTWTTQLTTLEARAAEHDKFSRDLISQVATPLEYNQNKLEDLRKSHAEYQSNLVKERDSSYNELKKLKGKYDQVCQEVESRRKKSESAYDHGRSKAANAYNQQLMDMHNVKNTYLIGINVTNKLKETYYFEYVPSLLDSLQDLAQTRVAKLNAIWTIASNLETSTLQRSAELMKRLTSEIPRNDPTLDSRMFIEHNAQQSWQPPPDVFFEPSPVWLDSDAMAVDETAKVFLRNILTQSKPLISQLKSQSEQKKRDLENVKKARQNIREGKDRRDEVDCVRSQFAVQEELHAIERKRLTAEVETSTITSTVGDLSLSGKGHPFRSETFKLPTNCDFCGDRIWGLSAKGFLCTDCGFTCHSKCQMKVPAECPGEQTKEEKKKLKAERQAAAGTGQEVPASDGSAAPALTRQDTMNSLSSGYAASATRSVSGTALRTMSSNDGPGPTSAPTDNSAGARRNRIVAPPPSAYVSTPANGANGSDHGRGRMKYPYEARDDGEISAEEGADVTILEPDGKISYTLWISPC